MANVPFPLTAQEGEYDYLKSQLYEMVRQVYEDKIGGADLGDVFSIVGDILNLVLADNSGLTKTGNVLAINPNSTGGIYLLSNELLLKLVATGGLSSNASGLTVKLDGSTLSLSASGLKVTASATDILATTTGINAKTIGTTNLYSVPVGKTAIITSAIIRCTAADAITIPPTLGIGIAAGEDDIIGEQLLEGLTATGLFWRIRVYGLGALGVATNMVKLGIDVGATATTMTIAVDLMGYTV